MKNKSFIFSSLALVLVVLFSSCAATKRFATTDVPVVPAVIAPSPVPDSLMEWDVVLSSPVSPMKQDVQSCFLPKQVYDLFPTRLDFPGWPMGHTLGIKNNLPGNSFDWGLTGDFIYWSLTDKKDNWVEVRETDPKEFMYIIKYKKDLMALWFLDSQTVRMKKVQWPTLLDRAEKIKIPSFDGDVEFKWSFEWIRPGYEQDVLDSVKGTVLESSVSNGFVFVTTCWSGGDTLRLPAAYTRISAGGKIVYAD